MWLCEKLLFKLIFILFLQWLGLFLFPHLVMAQVVINELYPAPSSGNDWVELKNLGSDPISLTDWSLENSSLALSTTPKMTDQTLLANGYLVLEVSNHLKNASDTISLRNSFGQVTDQASYTFSQTDFSWARSPDGTGDFNLVVPTRATTNPNLPSPTPTPSPVPTSPPPSPQSLPSPLPSSNSNPTPSPFPTPLFYSNSLQVSEIMSCPQTNEKEWLELYNPDFQTYTLVNWKLKDSTGNTRYLSGDISAQSFAAFELSSSMLNNDGDSLSLINPSGTNLFTVQFGKCQKGRSFVYFDGEWQETTTVTKGTANIYTSPDAKDDQSPSLPLNTLDTVLNGSPNSTASFSTQLTKSLIPTASALISSQFYPLSTSAALLEDIPLVTPAPLSDSTALNPQSPTFKAALFLLGSSLGLILTGSWGIYKWYTKRHGQEENLEFS